jgi:hypothetical protein
MKKVASILIVLHIFSIRPLWHHQLEEPGVLGIPSYLEKWAVAKQSERALCALLDIKGPEEFEQIVALISRCKPVVVMVYHKGDRDESAAREALQEASKIFKGSVAGALMECEKDSVNHEVLSHILLHAKVDRIATPAFLFFKDAGLYALDGSPAIIQGHCTKENLVKFIQTKFFTSSEPDCGVCACDFTRTPVGQD